MKPLESNEGPPREHLLISYASEDWVFADWLALELASEGYEVWYDRLKLLGGESYPRDTTKAIRNQTFRVIALLSRNSIAKLDPVKERTLALNIAKEGNIDFLIPLSLLPAYRRNPPRANAHKRSIESVCNASFDNVVEPSLDYHSLSCRTTCDCDSDSYP